MGTVRLHYDALGWEQSSDSFPVQITWEEAFAEPMATRNAVEGALNDPECREFAVHETAEVLGVADVWEDPVPPGAREACAADEAARLAMHQGHHLRRYAARLGNEWAIAVAKRFEDEIWDRATERFVQSISLNDEAAMRAARKMARPLFMVSFHSSRATESATMPPPAWM